MCEKESVCVSVYMTSVSPPKYRGSKTATDQNDTKREHEKLELFPPSSGCLASSNGHTSLCKSPTNNISFQDKEMLVKSSFV